jgi:AcrR family transcriptional regulator
LEENGFDGFTVQEVAARAAVSVGAIYERFGNKESLLRAVHARLMEVMAQDTAEMAERTPAPGSAREAIGAAVNEVGYAMSLHRQALRAFMHLGAVDEIISKRGSRASVELSKSFKRCLAPFRAELGHPQPDVALDVAFRMTYSTLARQVMYGPVFESDRRVSWKRLTDELTVACAAYLLQGSGA